ncbi:MAG: hypothetical protein WCJ45_04270 [bacterium]
MEYQEYQDIHIKPLTPKIAVEYLQFKQAYEGKYFIDTWNAIIPRYFTEEEFCSHINALREKRIEMASRGSRESTKVFNTAFDKSLWNKIKNKRIDLEIFRQLVGSLMSVYKSPKFKQFTENYVQDIAYVLNQIDEEKEIKEQKSRKKNDQVIEKAYKAKQKMEKNLEDELLINKELFEKFASAKQEFLDNHELGYTLSYDDKENIFLDVRKGFCKDTSLSKQELQKIYIGFTSTLVGL